MLAGDIFIIIKTYIYIKWYTVLSLTAKFIIININQKRNMFQRFLDRHHQAF
jgi:hypothetical protein